MRINSRFLQGLTLLLPLVYSCGNSGTAYTPAPKSKGQTIYETNCVACHGSDGKLGTLGAKDLSLSTMSREEAVTIITEGKNTMTPFRNLLSKEEIDLLADYVQTLKSQ